MSQAKHLLIWMGTVSSSTILFLLVNPEPIAGVAILLYGIPLAGIALILSFIFDGLSGKAILSPFVLTGAFSALASLFVILPLLTSALKYLPMLQKDAFIITLDVDTPSGPVRVSEAYETRTNAFTLIGKRVGRTVLLGDPLTLDLGNGNSVKIDALASWTPRYPREVYGYKDYKNGSTKHRKEIPIELYPKMVGTNATTVSEIKPEMFEEFYGQGIRFRRLSMQITN